MCKTLIVEDNSTFRKLLSTILCNKFPSMIIEEVVDGREVLETVEDFLPDLVFMDISLPEGNGLQLTRKIKTSHPGIVVVIFTNYDIPEYRDAALRFGATCFIAKSSWTSCQIIELVESILSDMNQSP
jgi:DNA-binding NarL/FixJ family response regulator